MIKAELKTLTTSAPSDAVLDGALARTVLTTKVSLDSLQKMVTSAQKAGFLKSIPPLEPLLAGAAG
jgi:NitT/TauT family transport system substrate-binding protein